MNDFSGSLSLFHPIIRKWFSERVGIPTDIQSQAWPEIARGRHVLVTAPTGSGKTLTAFLWALHQLVTGACAPGRTRVLYVSPLKALNNDIRRNLVKPREELRSFFLKEGGDFPPITLLTGITTVILDEIHAVFGTKWGTHLITAVDRLVRLSGAKAFFKVLLTRDFSPEKIILVEKINGKAAWGSEYPGPLKAFGFTGGLKDWSW